MTLQHVGPVPRVMCADSLSLPGVRRETPTPSPPPPPSGSASPATPTPARDARLAAIRLTDGVDGGTPVTLSSAFRPTVTSYGAVVSAQTPEATLCLQVLSQSLQSPSLWPYHHCGDSHAALPYA